MGYIVIEPCGFKIHDCEVCGATFDGEMLRRLVIEASSGTHAVIICKICLNQLALKSNRRAERADRRTDRWR